MNESFFKVPKIALFFNLIIYAFSTECPRESPIIKNDDINCISVYCSESQFNSGECKINNIIAKTQWLDNIIKFENTKGDINLNINRDERKMVFTTTSSNNEERIFFGLNYEETYLFRDENNHLVSYITKTINSSQNNEIINGQCISLRNNNIEYLFLITKENSDIQILNLKQNKNDFDYISKSELLNRNIKIKGDYSYCKITNIYFSYFGFMTSNEDESSDYNISLYLYETEIEDDKLTFYYMYHIEIDDVKGDYASFFVEEQAYYFSCFYLNKQNHYNLTLFDVMDENYYEKGQSIDLGSPSGSNNDQIFFFKGISLYPGTAAYMYYTGDNNEIPTLMVKKIYNFQFEEDFSINLTEYSFNNELSYNDLFKMSLTEFCFVSTSKNKEKLIIAHFKTHYSKGMVRMYYIIELKKYYNMKILKDLKGVNYNQYYLALSFNYFYCLDETCENPDENNKNTSLIIFSYANKSNVEIDLIDYIFTYNKNYIIIDLAENLKIENNLFGKEIDLIYRGLWEYSYSLVDMGIEMTFLDNGNGIFVEEDDEEYDDDDDYFYDDEEYEEPCILQVFFANNSKINISFANYSFEENYFDFNYHIQMRFPSDINKFIEYSDNFNSNYGDPSILYFEYTHPSTDFHYYINISVNLSLICNDSNCNLCFINDTNYCLLCKGDYNFVSDNIYGKRKICINDTITEETTYIENFMTTEITTIPTTNIMTTEITTIPLTTIMTTEITNIPLTTIMTTEITTIQTKNIITTEITTIPLTTIMTEITINPLTTISDILITDFLKDSTNIVKITDNNNNLLLFDRYINGEFKNSTLSDDEIKTLYKEVKNYLINDYNGNDTIIKTKNTKVQISSIDSKNNLKEISDIDLGECGEILKEKYSNFKDNSLIILKFDIIPENKKSTYVQYEIYDSNTKTFLELKECSGNYIVINIPIELDSEIEVLYDLLAEYGYNLFDANNSFYNDICATYTTQNDTDILLYDRRMDIYQKTVNISLCQDGCIFENYNSENKKAKCNCPPQKKEIISNTSQLEFKKNEMLNEFYEILKDSNFKVLKCYKLPFNIKIFIKNIGSIIMTLLLLIFLILIILYVAKSSKDISKFIKKILKIKELEKNIDQPENFNDKKPKDNKTSRKNLYSDKNIYIQNLNNSKGGLIINKKFQNNEKKKFKKNKSKKKERTKGKNNLKNDNNTDYKDVPPKRKVYSINKDIYLDSDKKSMKNKKNSNKNNHISNSHSSIDNEENNVKIESKKSQIYNNNDKNDNKKNQNIININNNINLSVQYDSNNFFKPSNKKLNKLKKEKEKKVKKVKVKKKTPLELKSNKSDKNNIIEPDKNFENYSKKEMANSVESDLNIKKLELMSLNDQEMNTLEYEKAVEFDKRNFFQYYISLLKKKQLILFTFLPANDYNIMSLKISLFIVSFSLYFTINAFFFSDNTMHKIYKEYGVYNILYRIPQILYSSIIPTIINMILKTLSLTEKDLLKIKKVEDYNNIIEESKKVERCVVIKFIIFFIISLLFMLFFWYFISCFCSVYNNTQIILIKDTLISFGISMIYPFGINLLPGIFRIPALRAEKKDKKCLYKLSQYIALI